MPHLGSVSATPQISARPLRSMADADDAWIEAQIQRELLV